MQAIGQSGLETNTAVYAFGVSLLIDPRVADNS